jgi:hypothetical protein
MEPEKPFTSDWAQKYRTWSLTGICCYTSPEDLDELALCTRKLTPARGQEAHRHSQQAIKIMSGVRFC